jgi:hypothetical protein
MVSIYHTASGWIYSRPIKSGYYNSLAEVMDAAYAAENRTANNSSLPPVRNRACYNCRFAKGG